MLRKLVEESESAEAAAAPEALGEETARSIEQGHLAEREREIQEERAARKRERASTPRVAKLDPKYEPKVKIALALLLIVATLAMVVGNASRFALDATQSWLFAMLFVGGIPAAAFGLEAYASSLSAKWRRLDRIMGYVFVASSLGFLVAFAQEFAYMPAIGVSAQALEGFDYRFMFCCQTLLEISLTFGLIQKIRSWLYDLRYPAINPVWRDLGNEIDQLTQGLNEVRSARKNSLKESAVYSHTQARSNALLERLRRFLGDPKLAPLVVAGFALFCCVGADASPSAAIVPSPYLSSADNQALKETVLDYLLREAEPETHLIVMDGWRGDVIAAFDVPRLNVDSPRARQRMMRESLGELLRWFGRSETVPSELSGSGALNLPLVVHALERHEISSVLIVGSPIFRGEEGAGHSWHQETGEHQGWWVPSDAAFFAGGGASPWAVMRGRVRLSGADIHWLLKGNLSFPGGRYAEQVQRFYGLYFELEGGRLVSYHGDHRQAFGDLFREDLKPYAYEIDPSQTTLAMRRAQSATVYNDEGDEYVPQISIPLDLMPKPIARVLVVDITMSMEGYYPLVAREIAMMPGGQNSLLLTFSDHHNPRVVTVFEESDDPSAIARALRSIELVPGDDEPEALGDAMRAVREELRARNAEGQRAEVIIWTDAPPKSSQDSITGIDCGIEMRALLEQGHRITLVRCREGQSTDWAPAGVSVKSL